MLSMLIVFLISTFLNKCAGSAANYSYLSVYPPGCDTAASLQCENDFLQCKLFGGPANDRTTLCDCARSFYGDCIRVAGVSFKSFPILLFLFVLLFSVKHIMKLVL